MLNEEEFRKNFADILSDTLSPVNVDLFILLSFELP
jgi:hypothetical protein